MRVSGRRRRHDDLLADKTLGRSATDVFRDIRERLVETRVTFHPVAEIELYDAALY